MSASPVAAAQHGLLAAVAALRDAVGPAASDDELVSTLALCETVSRQLDQLTVAVLARVERDGVFTERGYKSATGALGDLLRCDRIEARRRVLAAEHVHPQVGLDGAVRPPRLPATAIAFADGTASLRHVEVIARLLASGPAGRLTPEVWAGAEEQLAAQTGEYTPGELHAWGTALITWLDQDGPAPDDDTPPPAQVNELHLIRNRRKPGGKLTGRFDDPLLFDAIARAIDAGARPCGADEPRSTPERQAEALAEVCAQVLERGTLPETGGQRPVLTVLIRLEDLENRCRAAMLDTGAALDPAGLRQLACDAAVVPVVLDGASQPLDVGRIKRTVPDGLRRAVAARDLGCAQPGCDRPPSWCEVHHVVEWRNGGQTKLGNLVMLCKQHHRLVHASGWIVRIEGGIPEFIPPAWIDPTRTPRRKALPQFIDTG